MQIQMENTSEHTYKVRNAGGTAVLLKLKNRPGSWINTSRGFINFIGAAGDRPTCNGDGPHCTKY